MHVTGVCVCGVHVTGVVGVTCVVCGTGVVGVTCVVCVVCM